MTGEGVGTDGSAPAAPRGGPRFVSNANKLGYSPPLDGMRGLCMLLVILVHINFVPFASFAAMVDMFFVISGFLIPTLLFEEDRRAGRVDFRRFYTRRALRLLPLMYMTLLVTFLAFLAIDLLFGEPELFSRAVSDVLAGGTYTYHIVHPVHAELAGGGPAPIRPLIHLWSLTVEEHFYLFGVLAIMFAVRRRLVNVMMVAFVGAWIFIGLARATSHVGPNFMWYQRPDALLLGVVLACVHAKSKPDWSPRTLQRLSVATTVALVVLVATLLVGTFAMAPFGLQVPFLVPEGGSLSDGIYWGEFGFSIISACTAIIVIGMVRCKDHWLARFFSFKWFRFVGVRSYALYLIHVPLGVIMLETLSKKAPALTALLYLPLLALCTEVAHRLVEKPAMKLKHRMSDSGASGTGVRDGA